MAKAAKVVHESETQRQYIRLPLPAAAAVDGVDCEVLDLSSAGAQLGGLKRIFKPGERFVLSLSFPFEDFTMGLDLDAEVVHVDAKEKAVGCRFFAPDSGQVAVLNHLQQAFLSGDIVTGADVIAVGGRNNFTSARSGKAGGDGEDVPSFARQALVLVPLAALGAMAALFILFNILTGIFVVRADQAAVRSEEILLRAPADGIYEAVLEEDGISVDVDQTIALLQQPVPQTDDGDIVFDEGAAVPMVSPCDCFIARRYAHDGEFRATGEPLFALTPVESEPWIEVSVPAEKAHRLSIGGRAKVKLTGVSQKIDGTIAAITAQDTPTPLLAPEKQSVDVRIKPNKRLLHELSGRPARAEFMLFGN